MILCIVLAFSISALLIPFVIKFCNKHGIYDSVNQRKVHTGQIPRLGSIGFVTAFTAALIVYMVMNRPDNWQKLVPLIISGIIIFVFGIVDDLLELPAKVKLLVQCIAALIVVMSGYRFNNLLGLELGFFGYILTFGWIIGVVNSYNLIDGVDALCGGLSFFCFGTMALLFKDEDVTVMAACLILCGAITGFLLYNKPKAKIFMGDGGSQFLGFMVSVVPLYCQNSVYEPTKLLIIVLLCSIPIFDTIAAIWRRTREHRSFFSADKSHLHHKLMVLGFHTPGILLILYTIQLFLCLIVLFAASIGGERGIVLLAIGYIASLLFFTIIHYTTHAVMDSKKPGFKSELEDH